jgi:hypothetical protein
MSQARKTITAQIGNHTMRPARSLFLGEAFDQALNRLRRVDLMSSGHRSFRAISKG